MSAGGRALSQAIGQFGQSIGQMGETIYKVEADNEFRNQSLAIADGIEKFNTSLLTDPDHGTPGANEGYMKKWEDYKKSIDTQIQQVKNPLAKKNLEGYVTQVATKQHSSIFSMQYDGWSGQMVADGEKRISAIMAQAGMPVDMKMFAVVEELDTLQEKNLLKPGKRAEIQTKYLKQIASDEFIKKTQEIMLKEGAAAAREYALTAGFKATQIGDEFVYTDTGDIDKALAYVRIRGTDLGDKEYTTAYDKVLSGSFTESDKNTFLASENASDSQKSTVLREYYSRIGEGDTVEAIIGMGNFTRMANGETNVGKITTWADIESLARRKKIDASTLTYLQGQYNTAKNLMRKNNEDQDWVSIMLDIVDGKVATVADAIKRGKAIGKSEEARVLFLQTTAKNTTDATILANNDATDTLSSLENKIIAKTATEKDFDSATASFKASKDLLGEAYPGVTAKLQSLRWKFVDGVSETTRSGIEKRIRQDPNSVSDDEIWGTNISGADSSYLASLKLQSKDRATLNENDKALMNTADLYAVNEKIKRGEVLRDGEKALTRKELEGMKATLSPAAYVKYSELLDRDEAESGGMKEYWDYYTKVDAGTTSQDEIMKDKKLSFSMKADLLNRHAAKSGNDEQKTISKKALNLVRKLNGEDIADAEVLSYKDLATIKDPQAHQLAVNQLAESVKFLKAKGKSEKFLSKYKSIAEGNVAYGIDILNDKSLDPDDAVELFGYFNAFTRQNKIELREDVRWIRETENYVESQREKTGYDVILSIQDQILDGTYDLKKVDSLALSSQQKIQIKTLITSNKEAKESRERSKISWEKQQDSWLEEQAKKDGYTTINSVFGRVKSGEITDEEIDGLQLTDTQKIDLKERAEQARRYNESYSRTIEMQKRQDTEWKQQQLATQGSETINKVWDRVQDGSITNKEIDSLDGITSEQRTRLKESAAQYKRLVTSEQRSNTQWERQNTQWLADQAQTAGYDVINNVYVRVQDGSISDTEIDGLAITSQQKIQLKNQAEDARKYAEGKSRELIMRERQDISWKEDQARTTGSDVINTVWDRVADGTITNTEIDSLAVTSDQKKYLKESAAQYRRLLKNENEQQEARSKEQIQSDNATRVNLEYERAKRTAIGKLNANEKPLTIQEFQDFVDTFTSEQLPENVRRLYSDRASELDSTFAADKLSRNIRETGAKWVEKGSFTSDDEKQLAAEIEAAPLADKDWARAMVQTYKSNAQAVARQKADDAWTQSQRTRTAEEQAADDARKAQGEARKMGASRLLDEFKAKLGKGMTEDEYLGFQAQYIEIFKDAPEEFSSAFRLADVLYAGVTDKEYAKKESTLSSAFNELVSANTIDGYKATGDTLSIELINKTFPSDTKADVKGREYWMEKFQNFQRSDQANKVARTDAKTALIEARTASWDVLSGVAEYDPKAVYLDENLIKGQYQFLSAEDRNSFHDDLSQIARATEAKAEAERRAVAGTTATQSEKAKGNDIFQRLEGLASTLELANITMGAPSQIVQFPKADGTIIKLEASQETFDAMLSLYASELITAGKWGEAVALKKKFTGKVGDPIWEPVSLAIKNLTEGGKKPQNYPPAVKKWVESEIAQTKNPTPEYINTLVEGINKKSININLTKTFKLQENTPDVSEDYLTRMHRREFEAFIGEVDGKIDATSPYFTDHLKTWASKTLSTVNAFSTNGKLIEGDNVTKEVFMNGHVQFRLKNKTVLRDAGVSGDEAVFYLGFYGNDALPIVESKTGKVTTVKAWIPWEKQKGSSTDGRWVLVESYKDYDEIIRYRKTQEQIGLDKTMTVEKVRTDFSSPAIDATQNYPAFN